MAVKLLKDSREMIKDKFGNQSDTSLKISKLFKGYCMYEIKNSGGISKVHRKIAKILSKSHFVLAIEFL